MKQEFRDRKWGVVALLSVIGAVNYADRTALSAVLPLLRADLHISDLAIAAAGTCFLWSYALGCPFAGYLGDHARRSRVIFWSLLLWSAVTVLTAFVRDVPHLLMMRALLGLVECAYIPAGCALIADYHETGTRATAMGIHLAGLNLGVVAGGFLAGFLAERWGWRTSFLVLGGLGFSLALAARFYLHDPQGPPVRSELGESKISLFALFRISSVTVVVAEAAIVAMSAWVFLNWLPLYFSEVQNLDLAGAGLSGTFVIQIPGAVGIALGGRISDLLASRLRERRMLILGLTILLAAPLPFVFSAEFNGVAVSVCLLTYSLLLGLGQANEGPILCDLLHPRERATAFGILICGCNIAGGAAVLASGYIKPKFGFGVLFSLTSITLLTAAILCLVGYRKWTRRDLLAAACRYQPDKLPSVAQTGR